MHSAATSLSSSRPRVVLFAEPRSLVSRVLTAAALRAALARGDVEIAAVCDAGRRSQPGLAASARAVAAALVKRLFDASHPVVLHGAMLRSVRGAARRAGVPIVVPPGRNINHPGFVDTVRQEIRADLALSLGCMQIFGSDLLRAFRGAVNYHNGSLPAYRGLRATSWSVYRGEAATGFSFHRMSEGIDEGAVLLQGEVPVTSSQSVAQLEWEKTILAARSMDRVLDALLREDPGQPQAGPAGYFGRRDLERIQRSVDASTVPWDDLVRRIRAFDFVEMAIAGRGYPVSRLRRLGSSVGPNRLEVRTRDGVRAEPTLFMHLPLPLYRIYQPLRSRAS